MGEVVPIKGLSQPVRRCAILAIDPGRKSGAALYVNGEFRDAWQIGQKAAERHDVVAHCLNEALEHEVALCAAMETWAYYGGIRTALGLGEAAGRWKEQLELCGLPKSRVVGIGVNEWRKGIFGTTHNRHGTDGWKANAVQECRLRFGRKLPEDAAEAALLGLYASKQETVLNVLPKKTTTSRR